MLDPRESGAPTPSEGVKKRVSGRISPYRDFLRRYGEVIDDDAAKAVHRRLFRGESLIDTSVVDHLAELSKQAETDAPTKVLQARETLRHYFASSPLGKSITVSGGRIILYGSLEFGDPVNFDADLLAAYPASTQIVPPHQRVEVADDLFSLWKREGFGRDPERAQPHLDHFAFDYLHDVTRFIDSEAVEDFSSYSGDLSICIYGVPLFKVDQPWMEQLQQESKALAESHPFLTAVINQQLKNVLDLRLRRRNQKSYHNHK